MTPKGIVLDFDGVIARSMEQHAEAYRRVLAPYGIQPTDRDVFLQEGARSETIIGDALRAAGHDADADTVKRLANEKQQTFRSLGTISLYPGARDLVGAIADQTDRLALVTGTRRENLDMLIPDLLPLFSAVLAQDAYTHDKPHPEPYAKAAAALSLPPDRCAVLENAVRGVKSARAAGYARIFAITTTVTEEDLMAAGADVVAPDHDRALRALRDWLSGR